LPPKLYISYIIHPGLMRQRLHLPDYVLMVIGIKFKLGFPADGDSLSGDQMNYSDKGVQR